MTLPLGSFMSCHGSCKWVAHPASLLRPDSSMAGFTDYLTWAALTPQEKNKQTGKYVNCKQNPRVWSFFRPWEALYRPVLPLSPTPPLILPLALCSSSYLPLWLHPQLLIISGSWSQPSSQAASCLLPAAGSQVEHLLCSSAMG